MDFLNKAKAKLADIEGDLTKATKSLGIGEKKGAEASPSAPPADTISPQSTTMNTPSTSVAPSVAGDAPKAKLPLAIRKAVRDEYEVKIPELEAELSAVCGVPWRLQIDPVYVYSFAEDDFSKKYPGRMITKYVEEGTKKIKEYINKYGDDGTTELNKLASAHSVTLEPVTTQPINYCGCEISGGCLRLLFKKGMLGTNISDACSQLTKAINTAGAAAPGASVLDFNAKQGIKSDYEPKIGEVQAKIQQTLALPVLTLHPNFEENYALLDAFAKSGQADNMWPREWQKGFGSHTLMYFNAVLTSVENAGFGKDDMLQEGFQEAVEKNEISLKVVQKLEKSNYNEPVIKNGVLYIQTTPAMWTTNIRDCAEKLIDLL